MFANYGAITSVRKSKKKNFAHVRFEEEAAVERSLFLSGNVKILSIQVTESAIVPLFYHAYAVNVGFRVVKNDVSDEMSLVVRKLVFGVSDQVRHKPGCTTTEDG